MSLRGISVSCPCALEVMTPNLERQSGFNIVGQNIGNSFVEIAENSHRQLGFDSAVIDEVVDCVYQCFPNTVDKLFSVGS